jgi:[ribosomal protein S18]-alanine N-acetyltransferase
MWAGWRVSVPVDPDTLPGQIEFSETNAFCLVDDVRLVAFGQIVEKANRRGHLARVIVNPHDRRQGYGRILVERLIDVARARKLERVSLNVDATNAAAIALYALLGFRDAARPNAEPQAVGARYLERDV